MRAPLPYTRGCVFVFAAICAGLLFGSFLNVCIARLPRRQSVVRPGSHCPRCGAPIRPWNNVPLLSYGLLRGRCRACGAGISARYPLVEASLAALWAGCALRFGPGLPALEASLACFLLLGLLAMDAETLLLPNAFTLPGAALGVCQALLPGGGLAAALHLGAGAPVPLPAPKPWINSLLGALLGAGLLWLVRASYRAIRGREGMGLGDVKLAALLGAWLGVGGSLLALFGGVILGAAAGAAMLAGRGKKAAALQLPFGSFLCAAGLGVVLRGREMLTWYFHFFC